MSRLLLKSPKALRDDKGQKQAGHAFACGFYLKERIHESARISANRVPFSELSQAFGFLVVSLFQIKSKRQKDAKLLIHPARILLLTHEVLEPV